MTWPFPQVAVPTTRSSSHMLTENDPETSTHIVGLTTPQVFHICLYALIKLMVCVNGWSLQQRFSQTVCEMDTGLGGDTGPMKAKCDFFPLRLFSYKKWMIAGLKYFR